MKDWAGLILRICLGIVFVGHGLQKAFGLFGGPGINGFSEALFAMGFKPAIFWAYLAAYVELIG
ncbi:MAG: DoxX family protein, partial [Candidatus Omnitrophica bacterium]|nr:DoxX family protein [Candidatus Omnitrophota bacterium]